MQHPYGAPQPPYGHPQWAYPPQGAYPQQIWEVSPKKRNTVILLNFFLGTFGAHRFYLGKIFTGILMLLTLGGLLVWSFVDLVISTFCNYKDSKGRFVDKRGSMAMGVIFIVLYMMMPILAIAIPQYAKYRQGAMENMVQSACRQVMMSEEEYFAKKNYKYTADYGELEREASLQRDPNVDYGPIQLFENKATGTPGYRFTVRHKENPSIAYEVDTSSNEKVRRLSR
jgi:Tfp pilus assembly protein PilE